MVGKRQSDGYLLDFGDVKKTLRGICKEHNEYLLLPMKSDVLTFKKTETNIEIFCEDGSHFSVPKSDCKELPIAHTSAEELAEYICGLLLDKLGKDFLIKQRNITFIEISVSEAPGQSALYQQKLSL